MKVFRTESQIKNIVDTRFQTEVEVLKLREFFKMSKVRSGSRKCLRCDRKFFSEHLAAIKLCSPCRGMIT